MPDVVIVGAGPAGISAAAVLVDHGLKPVVIDEGQRPGGQAYRRPPAALDLDIDALLGSESVKFHRLHDRFEAIKDRIDYRPETLAWNIFEREIYTVSRASIARCHYDALILAPGAIDRVLPVKGWTLPGVFTLGGAQVLLKDQGCLIGRRIVFCGSSPLLYLAALQYRLMGAEVLAVLDTTPFWRKLAAFPDLAASPRTLMRGLSYMMKLRRLGVPIHHGARPLEIAGASGVERIVYRSAAGAVETAACDAVALGFGLRPETQLADLAGAAMHYNPAWRQWLPVPYPNGWCRNDIYLAGDGFTIGGADAAELSGRLAAYAVLEWLQIAAKPPDRRRLFRRLRRLQRFQRGLAKAFAWPYAWLGELPDEVPVCRCENITAGELRRAAAADFGPREINRAKAFTRVGMGRCQGRYCGLAAAEIGAQALGLPLAEIGRMRGQAPVKPLAMSARPAE